jgi:hypothetical protein
VIMRVIKINYPKESDNFLKILLRTVLISTIFNCFKISFCSFEFQVVSLVEILKPYDFNT